MSKVHVPAAIENQIEAAIDDVFAEGFGPNFFRTREGHRLQVEIARQLVEDFNIPHSRAVKFVIVVSKDYIC